MPGASGLHTRDGQLPDCPQPSLMRIVHTLRAMAMSDRVRSSTSWSTISQEPGGAGGRKVVAAHTPRTSGCRQEMLMHAAPASFSAHGDCFRATLRRATLLDLLRLDHADCSFSQLEGCHSTPQRPRAHSLAQTALAAPTSNTALMQSVTKRACVSPGMKFTIQLHQHRADS